MFDPSYSLTCPPGLRERSAPVEATRQPHQAVSHLVPPDYIHASMNSWKAGDVVLTRRASNPIVGAGIEAMQTAIASSRASHLVHVGVFDGWDGIREAVPGHPPVLKLVRDWIGVPCTLHVRRLRGKTMTKNEIDAAVRRLPPSMYRAWTPSNIVNVAHRIFNRFRPLASVPSLSEVEQNTPDIVCSIFANRVLAQVTKSYPITHKVVLPFDFAESSAFVCVKVPWRVA